MKKIHIALTPHVVKYLIQQPLEYSMALARLKQHTIIFSSTILDEYERYFAEYDSIHEFREWYTNFSKYDFSHDVEPMHENFEMDIVLLLEQHEHSILIKHDESFKCEVCSVLELNDINKNDSDNELSRQCIPTTFILPKGSSKSEFCRWLSELLADEKNITIVDRYILSPNARGVLKDIYIPTFPLNAKICVYFGETEKDQSEVSNLKNAFGNRIRMLTSISNDFHERHILGDSLLITIGVGLDVFDCNHCDSRKETNISVSAKTNISIPRKAPRRKFAYR